MQAGPSFWKEWNDVAYTWMRDVSL